MVFFPPRWGPHANRRKRKFGISERQIAFTWLYGESHAEDSGCWRLIGEEITLITDSLQLFIITLFPNRYKDRFIARNARLRRADGNVRLEWVNDFYDIDNLFRRRIADRHAYVSGLKEYYRSLDRDSVALAKDFDRRQD